MNNRSFQFRRFQITGTGKEPVELIFSSGLNVITGPSDSGKSFIFQCLDWILGGNTKPEEIPESTGYDTVSVELYAGANNFYTLRRALRGGQVNLYRCELVDVTNSKTVETLIVTSSGKGQTLSSFLLNLSGIRKMLLRINENDDKKEITWRSIWHLFAVSETDIITKRSPIIIEGNYDRTKSNSAFNALITGNDDSALIPKPKKEILKAQAQAKTQVYDELINQTQQELSRLSETYGQTGLPDVSKLDFAISEISDAINKMSEEVNKNVEAEQKVVDEITRCRSRLLELEQLKIRFDVLQIHYESDLQRLDFISEGDNLLSQLQIAACRTCGRPIEGTHEHQSNEPEVFSVELACQAEAAKVRTNLAGLLQMMADLLDDKKALRDDEVQLKNQRKIIADHREKLKPAWHLGKERLSTMLQVRRDRDQVDLLRHNINALIVSRAGVTKTQSEPIATPIPEVLSSVEEHLGTSTKTLAGALRALCDHISTLLNDWDYASHPIVDFDNKNLDFIIDGISRASHGKGIRALLHAAFNIALLTYSRESGLPHPGMVLLDSPLTTLKEKTTLLDDENEIDESIQQAFFASLALMHDEQIIVLENKVPNPSLTSVINLVEFTKGGKDGRYGLFPKSVNSNQ